MNRRWRRLVAAVVVGAMSLTACGAAPTRTKSITVYAASPLIRSFTAIGKEFEANHPDYFVEFVFAGSGELASALADGAAVDVFASGDSARMTSAVDAGVISGTPVAFAANRLVVVTAADNPAHVSSLADLARPGVRLAVCATGGSCGSATQAAARRSDMRLNPALSESTPMDVLRDVKGGRADAGIVFLTDAQAARGGVSWFALPGDVDDATSWISVVRGSSQAREAAEFVQVVTSATGRRILAEDGFTQPLRTPAN